MNSRKIVFKETAVVFIGMLIFTPAMIGVFALLGYFDFSVLLGGIIGSVLAILNFFVMAIAACLAADKAQNQDVKGGRKILQLSQTIRYILLFVLLLAFAKSGLCNTIAMALPVLVVRPIISFAEFFRKSGGETK